MAGCDSMDLEFLGTSMNRRLLMKRSIVLGLGASLTSGLLAACGGEDEDEPEDTGEATVETPTTGDGSGSAVTPTSATSAEPTQSAAEANDSPSAVGTSTTQPSAGEPTTGGTVAVGLYEEPATLDPHTTTSPPAGLVREHIYETLVTLGDDLGFVPMLADAWEVSNDGLAHEFALRQNATFHNGAPFTADDVKFTFERILEISPRSDDYSTISEIEVVDEHTVRFVLSEFTASFVAALSQNFAHIAPRQASEEDIAANGAITTPIGTGPYEFVSYTQGQEARVRRYEDYVPREEPASGLGGRKVAYIDELVFIPMVDEQVRLLALESGEIDHMQQFPPAEFDRVAQEGNLTTAAEPGTDWGALYFNFARPPFDDIRMRQAVAHGINWQQLADAVFWGRGVNNNSFIPQTQQFWRTPVHDQTHQYDPSRARQLIEEYGYSGETLEWRARNNYRDSTVAQTVQAMFKEIGLNFEIVTMESAAFLDGIYVRRQGQTPEWPLVTTTASSFRPDPDQHYYQRVHSSSHAGMYSNPEYDAIVEEARSISDPDERRLLYEEAQQIVMDDIPVIIIYNAPYLEAYSKRLQGVVTKDPISPFFWNVWIEE